jgi:hypothetical protein
MIEYINHIMQSTRLESTKEACKIALEFIKSDPAIKIACDCKVFDDEKDALMLISVIKYLTQTTSKNEAHG